MRNQNFYYLKEINNYIGLNIEYTKEYDQCLKQMMELSQYITQLNAPLNINLFLRIIKNNKIVEEILRVIVEKNIELIKAGELTPKITNTVLNSIVEAYCLINDINTSIQEQELAEIYQKMELMTDNIPYDDNMLQHYYKSISKPLLKPEEVNLLAYKSSQGDKNARRILIERNLRLTVYIAQKYIDMGLEPIDLIQEGNIGLIKAVDNFDPSFGCKFATFAVYHIKRRIIKAIANISGSVKITMYAYTKITKYKKEYAKLLIQFNREPTLEEMAKTLNWTLEETTKIYNLQFVAVSIDKPVRQEKKMTLKEYLASEDETTEEKMIEENISDEIKELIDNCHLTNQEKDILLRRNGFYNNIETLEKISQKYHISIERVRQIEKRALYKLRMCSQTKSLAMYMDDPDQAKKNANKLCEDYANKNKEKRRKDLLRNRKKSETT